MSNPRRRFRGTKPTSEQELDGYVELGMRQESLRIARSMLVRGSRDPKQIASAIDAILSQADSLQPWRSLLESAYKKLSQAAQKKVRNHMLGFFVALQDWETAETFLPTRPKTPAELLFAMWTLNHLRKPAKGLQRKCLHLLERTKNPMDASNLLEALASYHARLGELTAAEHYWKESALIEPFAHNALIGLVKIAAVRGQLFASAGLKLIERFQEAGATGATISQSKDRAAGFAITARELKEFYQILQKIVPPQELGAFGVDSDEI